MAQLRTVFTALKGVTLNYKSWWAVS